jgi:methylmalonyl-CoA/ethylmalonyl-CoA epimerase
VSEHLTIQRVAFAVRNLDSARTVFESLFRAEFEPTLHVESEEVRSIEWRASGEQPVFELVQPLDADGAIARFIRKRGEGIHHLTVAVPDLDEAIRSVTDAGGRVVLARSYYRDGEGNVLREAFLHPKDVHGVLFHVVEEA